MKKRRSKKERKKQHLEAGRKREKRSED